MHNLTVKSVQHFISTEMGTIKTRVQGERGGGERRPISQHQLTSMEILRREGKKGGKLKEAQTTCCSLSLSLRHYVYVCVSSTKCKANSSHFTSKGMVSGHKRSEHVFVIAAV